MRMVTTILCIYSPSSISLCSSQESGIDFLARFVENPTGISPSIVLSTMSGAMTVRRIHLATNARWPRQSPLRWRPCPHHAASASGVPVRVREGTPHRRHRPRSRPRPLPSVPVPLLRRSNGTVTRRFPLSRRLTSIFPVIEHLHAVLSPTAFIALYSFCPHTASPSRRKVRRGVSSPCWSPRPVCRHRVRTIIPAVSDRTGRTSGDQRPSATREYTAPSTVCAEICLCLAITPVIDFALVIWGIRKSLHFP